MGDAGRAGTRVEAVEEDRAVAMCAGSRERVEAVADDRPITIGAGSWKRLEDDRLVAIRSGLRELAAADAVNAARRIELLAEASEVARMRTARLTDGNSRAREMALRSISMELGAAVRMNDRTMQARLNDAARMMDLFPATVAALRAGRIDRAHADAVLDTGYVLTGDTVRAEFEHAVLQFAEHDTSARTRVFARQLAERLNPRTIDARFTVAHQTRAVTIVDLDDGMSELTARLATTVAHGIYDRLTRQSRALADLAATHRRDHAATKAAAPRAGTPAPSEPDFDERTRDQTRADLLADILLTGTPGIDPTGTLRPGGLGAITAHVQITVPVTTLIGTTTGGAELDGRSPIDTPTARRLAAHAPGWDRVMTDPVRGTVLDVDRYQPLASQRRYLAARDITCRAPGCRRPARYAHIDHNHEWHDRGRTRLDNLAHLCTRHHTLKTETDWTVHQLPHGHLRWTSPLGHTYTHAPPSRVVFLPDDDPPNAHPPRLDPAPF